MIFVFPFCHQIPRQAIKGLAIVATASLQLEVVGGELLMEGRVDLFPWTFCGPIQRYWEH
jgi:hypothetical protein